MKRNYIYFLPLVSILALVGLASGYAGKIKSAKEAVANFSNENVAIGEEEAAGVEVSVEAAVEDIENRGEGEATVEMVKNPTQSADESEKEEKQLQDKYPWHKNITVTFFWAGEEAGEDNENISNLPSAWDEKWVKRFGGVDDPKKRDGYFPAKFTPKENPFYFALPYNDFDEDGKRKKEIFELADWAREKKWGSDESVCKNQWIAISKSGKTAYAQWQDVGPFKEDDKDYVFGNAAPKSKINKNAGLDVSPAVRDYLRLGDIDKVDWKFVSEKDVPNGPWKKIVTKSQVYWN
ncbi:MAG: hypothetical protein UW87_C0012G0015 [Candidatus Moranbacteria bacterium GW2011_GWC2_45_10]|nr:MAG: hypothetical protein UW87_C0012G0015 [Candidatus Moranbacteria bacterium GW2011_GWC2_45_10]